jgi:hypothetical protein
MFHTGGTFVTYYPTPNDPTPPEGAFNPDEQPTPPRDLSADEAPTQHPTPQQQQHVSPRQPEGMPAAPASARGMHTQPFWGELSLLGQAAGVAGLLLLIFFFLPWSFTPDITSATTQLNNHFPTISHSGWSTASGLPLLGGTTNFNLFPQLWLVLISAIALIVITALLAVHRISLRLAAILITLISLFALLLEILFLVQMNSFQNAINDLALGRLNQVLYGVSWGFWLGLVATIVALGVGAYMLLQAYAFGTRGTPRAPRFPGDQQPYPAT